jgi:pimeloyl-ACP methyl ester carboxylesterase
MPLKLTHAAQRKLLSNVAPELRSKLREALDQAAKGLTDPALLSKLEETAVQAMRGANVFEPDASGKAAGAQSAAVPASADAAALDAAKQLIEYFAAQQTDPAKAAQLKGLEALLPYYLSTDAEKAHDQALAATARKLTPEQWAAVNKQAQALASQWAAVASDPRLEEKAFDAPAQPVTLPTPVPATLTSVSDGFLKTPTGDVVFAKPVPADPKPALPNETLFVGGGLPFAQIEMSSMNAKFASVAPTLAWDPAAAGASAAYEAATVHDGGASFFAGKPSTPEAELAENLALQLARTRIIADAKVLGLDDTERDKRLFKLTRFAEHGISLAQEAHDVASLPGAFKKAKGDATYLGISYGGILGYRVGSMYPDTFKRLMLVSPANEVSAHLGDSMNVSATLEGTMQQRRAIEHIVDMIVALPKYDDYRPKLLANDDATYRAGIKSRIMGMLDRTDETDDIKKVSVPIDILAGGHDSVVPVEQQLHAMRAAFQKYTDAGQPLKGCLCIIPDGGHALWGNPAEQKEDLVKLWTQQVLDGTLKDGGVYIWDGTKFAPTAHDGLAGLDDAAAFVAKMRADDAAKAPKP